jgi:hypothetical protein
MSKSIDEVWKHMQFQRNQQELRRSEQERKFQEQRELQRQEYLVQTKMNERVGISNASNAASSAAGGGTPIQDWIVYQNTAWIYPQTDIDMAVENMNADILLGPTQSGLTYSSVSFTRDGNFTFVFPTLSDVINFYTEMYFQSAVSQPVGNAGYSLGVGTILQSRRGPNIVFRLVSGIEIVKMTLMTQITNQSDLPSGGNSPNGAVGWGSTHLDWNADGVADVATDNSPNEWVDPLRFKFY